MCFFLFLLFYILVLPFPPLPLLIIDCFHFLYLFLYVYPFYTLSHFVHFFQSSSFFFSHLLLPHPSCFFFYPSAYLSSLSQVRNVGALLVHSGDTRQDTLLLCCVEQRLSFQIQRIGGVAAECGNRCQYSENKFNEDGLSFMLIVTV